MKQLNILIAVFAAFALGCQGGVEDFDNLPENPDEENPIDPDGEEPIEPPTETGARVTEGLVALYDFSEGTGTIVSDKTGSGYNLEILDPANVEWITGGLEIVANTALVNPNPATHITGACTTSNALTVETWSRTNSVAQEGPARVVTLSGNANNRNFTLAQDLTLAEQRLRTNAIEDPQNGTPATTSVIDVWTGQVNHVAFTRAADPLLSEGTIWLNGNIAGTLEVPGSFTNWDTEYPLTIANEPTLDRPWRGQLFLVAIYCRDLNAIEISQNMAAGY